MYLLFFGTSIQLLASSPFERSSFDNFETLVILSAILLPIKPPVDYAVFWVAVFEAIFIASVVDFLGISRSFWPYLLLKFLPMILAIDKNLYPFTYILSLGSIEYLTFIMNILFHY